MHTREVIKEREGVATYRNRKTKNDEGGRKGEAALKFPLSGRFLWHKRRLLVFVFVPFLSFCLFRCLVYLLALVDTQERRLYERPRLIMAQEADCKLHASTIRYARGGCAKTSPAISFWIGMLVGCVVLSAVSRSSVNSARFFTETGAIARANHFTAPDKLRALSRPAVTKVSPRREATDPMLARSETATSFRRRADVAIDNFFSSFECVGGGSQVPDFPLKQSYFYGSKIDVTERRLRICKLRDVCLVNGRLRYYMDPSVEGRAPQGMRITAFPDGGPVCVGLLPLGNCSREHVVQVEVEPGPRPAHLLFAGNIDEGSTGDLSAEALLVRRQERGGVPAEKDDSRSPPTSAPRKGSWSGGSVRVHMLDIMSDPSNWAHLMLDTLLPAYAAAELFDDDIDDVQIVSLNSCSTFDQQPDIAHKAGKRIPGTGMTLREACEANVARWVPELFRHDILMASPNKDVCFRSLVMGHSHSLGLGYWFPHRGVAARHARQRIYSSLGIPDLRAFEKHHIIVLSKKMQWTGPVREGFDLCDVVGSWLASAHDRNDLSFSCISPSEMSVKEQVAAAADATVILAEEGSTSYLSLFQRPGSSLVVVGSKEMYILYSLSDVQVWFIDPERIERSTREGGRHREGKATLRLAMDRAGRRLGINALP